MIVTIMFSSHGNICRGPTKLDLNELSSWTEFCKVLEEFALIKEKTSGKEITNFLFFIEDRPISADTIKEFYKPRWSWSAGLKVGVFAWLIGIFVSIIISKVTDIPINNVGFDWLVAVIAITAGLWAARNLGGKL